MVPPCMLRLVSLSTSLSPPLAAVADLRLLDKLGVQGQVGMALYSGTADRLCTCVRECVGEVLVRCKAL